jgi:hypothetical protein
MIDANVIADLQMRMNAGDGRQAVLAELLRLEGKLRDTEAAALTTGQKPHDRSSKVHSQFDTKLYVIGGPRKHLSQQRLAVRPEDAKILADFIAILDQLAPAEKEILHNFVEVLAHAFNNLFMTIVGHISIVMYRLEPSDPLCHLFRSSEDQIHNTAMMIRLMVDVFQSPQTKVQILQLVDMGRYEIDKRDFGDALKATRQMLQSNFNPLEQEVLKNILGCMAQLLQSIVHVLQHNLAKAFHQRGHRKSAHHFRQIRLQIKKAETMCGALKDFAQEFSFNRSALVSQLTFQNPTKTRQTVSKIKRFSNHLPHSNPVNLKETVCIGNVCMTVERQAD